MSTKGPVFTLSMILAVTLGVVLCAFAIFAAPKRKTESASPSPGGTSVRDSMQPPLELDAPFEDTENPLVRMAPSEDGRRSDVVDDVAHVATPTSMEAQWSKLYADWDPGALLVHSEQLTLRSVTLSRDAGIPRLADGEGVVLEERDLQQLPKSKDNPLYAVAFRGGKFRQLFLERERYPDIYALHDEAVWVRREAYRRMR